MSNTGNRPPGGTPPASSPKDADSPASSEPGADAKPASTPDGVQPPASTPAPAPSPAPDSKPADSTPPASTSPDSAPASAPATGAQPPSSPSGTDAATASQQTPDSTNSDDCVEIPTAPHAVLEVEIKLLVRIPRSVDEAQQMPHKFTLTSDDGSVNTTVPASSAEAGDVDGTSVITFTGLAEHHVYTLQCDNGSLPIYTIFQGQPYEAIGEDDGSQDSTPPYGDSSGGDGYDNGINVE
jgi:hypothetical protein